MSPQPDMVMFEACGLSCAVDGRTLWHDVQLTIRAGDRWAIAGSSGSGKTLLLRTLAGLMPVQKGTLAFHGRALNAWPMPAYRARVVYLPQRPALREGRVEAALQAPFAMRVRRDTAFPRSRAIEWLAALGHDACFLEKPCERLSGGEAQIVALLRALLIEPDVLLLDEPTASLDAEAVGAIERGVARWLAAASDRACVWTSHDRAQLERMTDRQLTLGMAT